MDKKTIIKMILQLISLIVTYLLGNFFPAI